MTKTMSNDISMSVPACVIRGSQLLDEHRADWWSVIDITKLHMESDTACVLGQLYGTFAWGLHELGLPLLSSEVEEHGFSAIASIHMEELRTEWIRVINERRSEDHKRARSLVRSAHRHLDQLLTDPRIQPYLAPDQVQILTEARRELTILRAQLISTVE